MLDGRARVASQTNGGTALVFGTPGELRIVLVDELTCLSRSFIHSRRSQIPCVACRQAHRCRITCGAAATAAAAARHGAQVARSAAAALCRQAAHGKYNEALYNIYI